MKKLTQSHEVRVIRSSLFRPESLREQQMAWLGRRTLVLGLPATLLGITSVLMVIATTMLFLFGNYARRVELQGVILPTLGLISVSSPVAGWIEAIKVQDGEVVERGTQLYIVNTDVATSNGNTQQQVLKALSAQRVALVHQIARKTDIRTRQDAELQRKAENLLEQIQQMTIQVDTKNSFFQKLTRDFADYNRFVETGIGNLNERQFQQQNWMRAKDDLEELKSKALRLQAQLIEIQSEQATNDLQIANEIDGMRAKMADLDQQVANTEARRAIEIRAPGAGVVTAIINRPGQLVASGTRMLTIVPSQASMQAQLLAPSTAIGFIYPSQRVLLRYSAFPYQKFGEYWGTIVEVSRAALQLDELSSLVPSLPPSDRSKTFYRVTVAPDRQSVTVYNHPESLQASMQVNAHVLLEKRPIYQWILEPLYGLHGS